ncbi:hypothetical protein [Kordiimonas sp.]|uniref:hypothetical protein n=1 Tax=Kordiimonas sp. TaxID=1970157 RepID=UPI003B51B103
MAMPEPRTYMEAGATYSGCNKTPRSLLQRRSIFRGSGLFQKGNLGSAITPEFDRRYKDKNMNRLMMGRGLLAIGMLVGTLSWAKTISHVGDPAYLLIGGGDEAATHAWYHAFREAFGDMAAVLILLAVFFGPEKWRTPQTWVISMVLMAGYYAPFWVGTPFIPELAAPHILAEVVHVIMAAFPLCALFISRQNFIRRSGL